MVRGYARAVRESVFELRWFRYGLLAIVIVTAAVLAVISVIDQRILAASAARDAASYTAPTISVQGQQRLAAFIGDSYSAGAGSTLEERRFTTRVSVAEGWQEENEAFGGTGYASSATENGAVACGQAVCPAYPDVIERVAKLKPDVVVVSGGRNDVPTEDGKVRSSVSAFFVDLRKALPDTTIYVTSPVWDYTTPPAKLGQIAGWVKAAAKGVNATYLDIGEPLQGHRNLVASDGVHPNDAGHAALATAIEKALRENS
jgi:lysophospholipase L1-like esterase